VKTVFASATERDIYTVSLFTYINGLSTITHSHYRRYYCQIFIIRSTF
jgi:hypothetical protein